MTQAPPPVTDFEGYLAYACSQLEVDVHLVITRVQISPQASRHTTARHEKKVSKVSTAETKPEEPKETQVQNTDKVDKHRKIGLLSFRPTGDYTDEIENQVIVTTVYEHNTLVQIKFEKRIPREMLKIIGLILPYQQAVTSLTLKKGLVHYTMHELRHFLPKMPALTELCFDGSYLAEANFEVLLDDPTNVRHLSLARCCIDDLVVEKIAEKISHRQAAKKLTALNLSTNRITDIGAKHLADALRRNRQLAYLNLNDNLITDEGAKEIFDVLKPFPLTMEEVMAKKACYIKYLLKKMEIKSDSDDEEITKSKLSVSQSENNTKKASLYSVKTLQPSKRTDSAVSKESELLDEEFKYPFNKHNLINKEGLTYCLGNNNLVVLNLAYNDLSYLTLKKLKDVLDSQIELDRQPRGLMKVCIEGNNMPSSCQELDQIKEIFQCNEVVQEQKKKNSATLKKKTKIM
ncbi:leucine-rich repeat-containing protein 71 [Plutella xylostella]|uniref:leucine-rich repeat-containing protein 71 n=1 Tax=Plutella xylostella TaxID=51655 RepID=UPI0020322EDD|nr:leucine-rich repeat-containing protein 71 [Plutella xylostella]